jgi:hypothetical protein
MAIRSMQLAGALANFDNRELIRAGELRRQLDHIHKSIAAYNAICGNLENQGFEEYGGGKESEGVASFRHHESTQAIVDRAVKALQHSGFGQLREARVRGILVGSADIKGIRVSAMIQLIAPMGVRVMLTFGGLYGH